MRVEIDQSGKLEQLNTGTAIAFSNGIKGAVWIPVTVKREVIRELRKTIIPSTDVWSLVFAVVIYLLVSDLAKNAVMDIDEEYTGKEKIITEAIAKLFGRKWGNNWKGEVRFKRVGKRSPAHKLAWEVHRWKNRQGVRELKASVILKLMK